MGIPIEYIKQGCCDSQLSSFSIINADKLDDIGSTCDKVIDCNNKYILVEEKSILIGFFHKCCMELGKNFDSYKYTIDNIEYLKLTELMKLIRSLDKSTKKMLLSEKIVDLLTSSPKKASNTTDILCKKYDNTKTSDMSVFYLYCNSGKPIDMIMYSWLSRYKNNIFIECQALKQKLEEDC